MTRAVKAKQKSSRMCFVCGLANSAGLRAALYEMESGEVWGVTVEFTARYRTPVPLDAELRVVGRIVKDTGRFFEGTGEILLPDGTVAVEGRGRYLHLPLERIAESYADDEDWRVVASPDDPTAIAVEGPAADGPAAEGPAVETPAY